MTYEKFFDESTVQEKNEKREKYVEDVEFIPEIGSNILYRIIE